MRAVADIGTMQKVLNETPVISKNTTQTGRSGNYESGAEGVSPLDHYLRCGVTQKLRPSPAKLRQIASDMREPV